MALRMTPPLPGPHSLQIPGSSSLFKLSRPALSTLHTYPSLFSPQSRPAPGSPSLHHANSSPLLSIWHLHLIQATAKRHASVPRVRPTLLFASIISLPVARTHHTVFIICFLSACSCFHLPYRTVSALKAERGWALTQLCTMHGTYPVLGEC